MHGDLCRRAARGPREVLAYLFRRLVFWFGFYIRPPIHWFIVRSSKVGNPPVFERDVFDWVPGLEGPWETIRDEAQAVLERPEDVPPLREVSPDHGRIATDEKWKVFFLIGYGYEIEANTGTLSGNQRTGQEHSRADLGLLSIHTPGTYLPRHYGPTNGMITCHLGLNVPKDRRKCRIAIDAKDYHWDEGKFLIFDDTYYHEVWNETDENRVVLLIHVGAAPAPAGQGGGRRLFMAGEAKPFYSGNAQGPGRLDDASPESLSRRLVGG